MNEEKGHSLMDPEYSDWQGEGSSQPPSQRDSNALSKTLVKLLGKIFCFSKVKIDRKFYDLEKEAPQNHADYLYESVNKV